MKFEELNKFKWIYSELDQEEEERRKQEVEAARAMEDGGFDDPIEPEDPTDVNQKQRMIFIWFYFIIF